MELPGPVVEAGWLADHLDSVTVADVRWSIDRGPHKRDYLDAHIPGSVFVDLDVDLSAPAGVAGRHPLPSPNSFAETRARLGLDGRKPVISYDDSGGAVAARLWWMLDSLGVPVAVLNGGLSAWSGELSSGIEPPQPSAAIKAAAWPADRFIIADEVERALAEGAVLLDARSDERFRGEPNSVDARPGHIPGATSRPWTENVESDGRFLDESTLRSQFEQLGVDSERDLVASCGSGVTACHDLLACRLAGFTGGRLYAGSWSEWGSDQARPVEVVAGNG